ncbi:cytochrome d ubiquinol oxidase subunit II [Calidifontibacter terrae]
MTLEMFWFILIAVLWTGYFVLEGFDFGVGMSLPILGRGADGDTRRRVLLTSIGPFWDGNEVWLITAGGAMFAAFPAWYGTMFSGFYLALLILLVALIVRNMGFEYRHKRDSAAWRRGWDASIIIGSVLPPLLLGIALTNIVRGVPIVENAQHDYVFTGNLLTLFNPMSLLGGLTFVALSLTHGMHFVALKTAGDIRGEARSYATRFGLVSAVLAVALLLWIGFTTGSGWSWGTTVIAALALVASIAFNLQGREGMAFVGSSLTWVAAVATYFLALFPNVMPSSVAARFDLTVSGAASSHLTLQIMTGAALVFTPIAVLYSAWNYWVFRKRISVDHIPPAHDPLAQDSSGQESVEA